MRITVVFCSIFLVLTLFCQKNPQKPEEKKPQFTGIVEDENGTKVENVAVHFLLFEWPWGGKARRLRNSVALESTILPVTPPAEYALYQNYPNPFNPVTCITYQMPIFSKIKISILNYPEDDTVMTLVDGNFRAGRYVVVWDGRDKNSELLTNGLYKYTMEAPNFSDYKMLCINQRDAAVIALSKAKFHSDKNGFFEIDYPYIPVGKAIPFTDETGPEVLDTWIVPDSITVALSKSGYETLLKKVLIDTTRYAEHLFTLRKK